MEVNEKKIIKLPIAHLRRYFDLPAFLAQASLQYFDFASNVVYFFLQTGHFLSINPPHDISYMLGDELKAFPPREGGASAFPIRLNSTFDLNYWKSEYYLSMSFAMIE